MQIWNSGELLLVLGIIVLSLENNFERPQMMIVLMKQMWKTVYQPDTVKKKSSSRDLKKWGCLLFGVQLVFVSGGAGSLSAGLKVWESHLNSSVVSGSLHPSPVFMN